MKHLLTPQTYDEVVSALTGNGELCTTLSPTGYHVPPELRSDKSHLTQHFVWAGRRRMGPQHPLIDFGTISRSIRVGGHEPDVEDWEQEIDYAIGVVFSRWKHRQLREETRSFIALADNLFCADTVLRNEDDRLHHIDFTVAYRSGEADAELSTGHRPDGIVMSYRLEEHLGDLFFGATISAGNGEVELNATERGAETVFTAHLEPGQVIVLTTWLHFSDRLHFEFPITPDKLEGAIDRHEAAWREFWSRSEVVTGEEHVDDFRRSSLYTLRCQATPWSIPPTVSQSYWGAGTFHDEMYPFLGLLSSNHAELAERVPYFRLTTLPQAQARARGRGALYPWSSTEYGEERDPNGLWLTERFHLGQFAVCIQYLYLYERSRIQLSDLYPVLRDLARYFEMNLLEYEDGTPYSPEIEGRAAMGRLRARACVDFDESVGAVTNGPFTICAAIVSMEYAAHAAELLARDTDRIPLWRSLAAELRRNLPTSSPARTPMENGKSNIKSETYVIPDDKPLHYSILGPIFPFRIDVNSPLARRSAEHIHKVCRSTKGWKPGFSEVFEGSNWMWTAGHLGIVHALQGNGELAWEAVRDGPTSAGPFLSPNEHIDGDGIVQVPWFTTGCGGWLFALNALFVQVDEEGTKLLPAVPKELKNASFRDLRAEGGVLVSGEFKKGKLVSLTVRAPRPMSWRFRIPKVVMQRDEVSGDVVGANEEWVSIATGEIGVEAVSLLKTH
jgi:hypothetical protein